MVSMSNMANTRSTDRANIDSIALFINQAMEVPISFRPMFQYTFLYSNTLSCI
uniref:Unkown protein n=1 Tax=Riptortus pedestris TaxID=329032 RepID=R4WPZ5_RIPPE|nr:unkown protein [Riptortus pedestris]